MADHRSLLQRTGSGGRIFPLLLLIAAAALSILLLRPICEIAFAHVGHGDGASTCCSSVSQATQSQLGDLVTPAPGGTQPVALAALPLFIAVAGFLPRAAVRFASAAAPPLSYYARTTRILR